MKRTPEELNRLDQAKIQKRRVMLARAKDPRVMLIEETVENIHAIQKIGAEECGTGSNGDPMDFLDAIERLHERLVREASGA